jgi:cobyrinic acid a,c-diamide synthase
VVVSGALEGRAREEAMVGVRRRMRLEELDRAGRKACVVARTGRSVLFIVEVQICGEVAAMAVEGYVREGMRRRAVNVRGDVVEEVGGERRLMKCGIMAWMSVG